MAPAPYLNAGAMPWLDLRCCQYLIVPDQTSEVAAPVRSAVYATVIVTSPEPVAAANRPVPPVTNQSMCATAVVGKGIGVA